MIEALRHRLDSFFGRGRASVAVPTMDGALRPNAVLESAPLAASIFGPDNLVDLAGKILFSSGNDVHPLGVGGDTAAIFASAKAPITCLAAESSGALAVGTNDDIVVHGGRHDGKSFARLSDRALFCVTAIAFAGPDELLICMGSTKNDAGNWQRDLLQGLKTGSLWRLYLDSGKSGRIADRLAWPCGLIGEVDGSVLVSLAWEHRIVRVSPDGSLKPYFAHLPGYPGRLSPAAGGGYWLSVFAPRSQMVEFVRREPEFRKRMMKEVDPSFWMAPSLHSRRHYMEPIQGGQIIYLGVAKPWAPSRSYGLVIRLDSNGLPQASYHSRANGVRHGTTSCLEADGHLLVASKGGNAIVNVDLAGLEA